LVGKLKMYTPEFQRDAQFYIQKVHIKQKKKMRMNFQEVLIKPTRNSYSKGWPGCGVWGIYFYPLADHF